MSDSTEEIQMETEDGMKKAISHLATELSKIRAGKATPQIVDGIMVDYYGNPTPINQVSNVNIVDARTISIQPFEKDMLMHIDRAIMAANIGITPQNDGTNIRLFMPPLTEERRKDLVKNVFAEGENAKVSIRNIRRDAMENIKKLQKDGMSEDAAKDAESEIQNLTDSFSGTIENTCKAKEKELMTV